MSVEAEVATVENDLKKRGSAISGGIFLISLGVLIFTDWWWPGIMFALGLSGGAELIFRGKIWRGIGTIAFFSAIPIVVWIVQETAMGEEKKDFQYRSFFGRYFLSAAECSGFWPI